MDDLRIGDTDRDSAIGLLGEQYAAGRLTKDEFDERSDAVWSARTRGDLAPVFEDLPVRAPAVPAASGPHPSRPGLPWGLPFLPVLFVLVAVAVLVKLPVLLLVVGLWVLFGRCHGPRRSRG